MNPRADIDDLKLQNSPNLKRALDREANASELSEQALTEVEQLNALIQLAMRAAKRGNTLKGKRNPAYQNLLDLVKTRELLARGKKPSNAKSTKALLADAEKLLGAK